MKKLLLFFAVALGLSACERDDFCTGTSATPQLILRFYDKDDTSEFKRPDRLSIIAEGKTDSLYTSTVEESLDSIALPLDVNAMRTTYILKMNDVDGNIANNKLATLTVEYDTAEEFVSRPCGFRIVFNDVVVSEAGDWVDSIIAPESTGTSGIVIPSINDQSQAHVQVYF